MTASVAGAFLGGLLTLFAPCSALLLPAFFSYAFSSPRLLVARTGIFYLGLLTTLVPLGVAAGGLGHALRSHAVLVTNIGAGAIIALGIALALGFSFSLPGSARLTKRQGASDAAGSGAATSGGGGAATSAAVYLLGALYGLAGAGCAGPILGGVLFLAGLGGQPSYGALLLAVYGAGMALPLLLLAVGWGRLEPHARKWLRPRPVRILGRKTTLGQVVTGLVMIALGALLFFSRGTTLLPGLFDSGSLISLESEAAASATALPNWLVLALLVTFTALLVVVAHPGKQKAAQPARYKVAPTQIQLDG
ncbi:MAG: cytochrome c biogenesis CcdA family protein [Buchananella hordeovulneris]|nr:cytochrome c biogenesis CcdA family protein [Buchananella hordeovulneris]